MNSSVFIDARYLIRLLSIKKKRIDFLKLSNELTIGTNRIRTIFYDTLPIPGTLQGNVLYAKTQRFHSRLRALKNFEVRLGRLQQINENFFQKGVDMRLGADLVQMSMKREINKAIIITSDSDFEYAIEKAKEAGVIVSLAYFPSSKMNSKFLQTADELILLKDDLLDKCRL
jgi:uncharacterized LabA/DUF88 family protein